MLKDFKIQKLVRILLLSCHKPNYVSKSRWWPPTQMIDQDGSVQSTTQPITEQFNLQHNQWQNSSIYNPTNHRKVQFTTQPFTNHRTVQSTTQPITEQFNLQHNQSQNSSINITTNHRTVQSTAQPITEQFNY